MPKTNKPDCCCSRALDLKINIKNLRSLNGFHASCAYVARGRLSVYYVGNLLNVCLKSSSRSSLGVADVVTGGLSLAAYFTNFRHFIYTSVG